MDVGPGLCVVTKAPPGTFFVYDAGHWVGKRCIEAVREIVTGDRIELLVLSHSDADHLGDAVEILEEYFVPIILRAGDVRSTSTTWQKTNDAIAAEVREGATVINFRSLVFTSGLRLDVGEAAVVVVGGFADWTAPGPTESERRNAVSIVVRLEYNGRSVLLTGDTVGRRLNDPDSACKDAEKVMVDNHQAGRVSLKADVIVAPHHGANNGSSRCFIQAVDPRFVIFSAGHAHQHPTEAAAERYLAHGVPVANIFRTDRGDDEPGPFEWKVGSISGCRDPRGDDDVEDRDPAGRHGGGGVPAGGQRMLL